MEDKSNPALAAFVASFPEERVWAQVLIRRLPDGFELLHVADREAASLRPVAIAGLRQISLANELGQFRPLKSAPDLPRGWRAVCRTSGELWRALQELYPGSIPDWFAVQSSPSSATGYRDFTNRQTGMYRITQLNSDAQAARVIAACCAPSLCLKQRLWTAGSLPVDVPEAKSAIPCLEPCALLLELARKAARLEQEEKLPRALSPSDWESLLAAARHLSEHPPASIRSGDIASPLNPRRLRLLLETHQTPS